jgi:hypothetical protein
VLRYAIELDAYRAEQARQRIPNIVQGNTLEVQCPVECFGLLYLNPPYDWTLGPADSRRTEQMFLSHTYRWLKPGGVLVFVIPGDRLAECSQILSTHFRDVRVYRLEAPECVRYKQVVVIGARRSRREKERLTDSDITRARLYYASLARNPSQIPVLPSEPEARYDVPVSGPAQLVYRGLPWMRSRICCRSQRPIDRQDAFSLLSPCLPQAGPSHPCTQATSASWLAQGF